MAGDETAKNTRMEARLVAIEKMLKEIKGNGDNVLKKINDIEEKISNINTKIQVLEVNIAECMGVKAEVDTVMIENRILKERMLKIENNIENALIKENRCSLEVFGIPDEGNNIDTILLLAKLAKVNLAEKDLRNVFRTKGRNGKEGLIKVSFHCTEKRDEFLKRVKIFKPNRGNLKMKPEGVKIYINEALTQNAKQILFQVKTEAKIRKWKYVWAYAGRIYLKLEEGGQQILIGNMEDLEKMIK